MVWMRISFVQASGPEVIKLAPLIPERHTRGRDALVVLARQCWHLTLSLLTFWEQAGTESRRDGRVADAFGAEPPGARRTKLARQLNNVVVQTDTMPLAWRFGVHVGKGLRTHTLRGRF